MASETTRWCLFSFGGKGKNKIAKERFKYSYTLIMVYQLFINVFYNLFTRDIAEENEERERERQRERLADS